MVEPNKEFSLQRPNKGANGKGHPKQAKPVDEEAAMNGEVEASAPEEEEAMNGVVDGEAEAMDVPLRPEEKRRLNWDNGLYLAPLTTVGNLVSFTVCLHKLTSAFPPPVYRLRSDHHHLGDGFGAALGDWPQRGVGPCPPPQVGEDVRCAARWRLAQPHGAGCGDAGARAWAERH